MGKLGEGRPGRRRARSCLPVLYVCREREREREGKGAEGRREEKRFFLTEKERGLSERNKDLGRENEKLEGFSCKTT